jgi:quinolinate synthase
MEREKVKEILGRLHCKLLGDRRNEINHEEINCVGKVITLINELETKNEVLCVELSRYTENCVEMKNGTLKQFAEKLKEKAKNLKLGSVEVHNFLWVNDIDETLKEFLK